MAGEKVISGDMRITLDGDTVWHSTSCGVSMTREFTERSTKDTTGIERAKGEKSWTATCEGLGVYGGDGVNTLDFYALFDQFNDDTETPLNIEFLPDEGDAGFKLTGQAFLENLEKTMPNNEDSTISFSLVGTGFLTKTAIT